MDGTVVINLSDVLEASVPADGYGRAISKSQLKKRTGLMMRDKYYTVCKHADSLGFFGDILLLVGDCTSSKGSKGYRKKDMRTALEVWGNFVLIVKMREHYSSQACPMCLGPADFLCKRKSLRRKVCRACPANDGHDYRFDRDVGASLVMYQYLIYALAFGELPPFTTGGSGKGYAPSNGSL